MAQRKVQNTEQETKEMQQVTEARDVQDTTVEQKEIPDTTVETKELPSVGVPENTVVINGRLIEIKPMKLKYQRNRTAAFYHALDLYPLPDILAMDGNTFGKGRDGDKALTDWLVAVFDDEDFVRENLDEIDSDMIYKLLAIVKRINKIDEKEEKLKNLETPGQKRV